MLEKERLKHECRSKGDNVCYSPDQDRAMGGLTCRRGSLSSGRSIPRPDWMSEPHRNDTSIRAMELPYSRGLSTLMIIYLTLPNRDLGPKSHRLHDLHLSTVLR